MLHKVRRRWLETAQRCSGTLVRCPSRPNDATGEQVAERRNPPPGFAPLVRPPFGWDCLLGAHCSRPVDLVKRRTSHVFNSEFGGLEFVLAEPEPSIA